jgi:hypothetical protein
MEILNLDDYLVDLSTKDAIDAHTYNKESDDEGNIGVLSLGPGSRFSPTRKEMLMLKLDVGVCAVVAKSFPLFPLQHSTRIYCGLELNVVL